MYVGTSVYRQSPGLGQNSLPRVTAFKFRNTGVVDPENCCGACTRLPATGGRLNLGVGLRGTGAVPLRAANGMELSFTIAGHRPGLEYDIVRTLRYSFWERVGGAWRRLESDPMGTHDDATDHDECLRPSNSNRIFVEDRPGWPGISLPAAAAQRFPGIKNGVSADAAATELVCRLSFAEWVIARSRIEGIPWTRLALPPRPDGKPRRFIFWHSIMWLIRNALDQWVLDLARSRIQLGSLSGAVIRSHP